VKLVAVKAVAPDKHATGAQNAERLTQHSCLKRSRRDVVKHGERRHRVERAGGERKRRGIGVDYLDAVRLKPGPEHGDTLLVALDDDQPPHPRA
jgi:hypothetical protein